MVSAGEVGGSFWTRLDAVRRKVGFVLWMGLNAIGGEVGCSFVERLNVVWICRAVSEVGRCDNVA